MDVRLDQVGRGTVAKPSLKAFHGNDSARAPTSVKCDGMGGLTSSSLKMVGESSLTALF